MVRFCVCVFFFAAVQVGCMVPKILSIVGSAYSTGRAIIKHECESCGCCTDDKESKDKYGFFSALPNGELFDEGRFTCGCCSSLSRFFRCFQRLLFSPYSTLASFGFGILSFFDKFDEYYCISLAKTIVPIAVGGLQFVHDIGYYGIYKHCCRTPIAP